MTPEEQGGKAASEEPPDRLYLSAYQGQFFDEDVEYARADVAASEEREAIAAYLDELAAYWRRKAESPKNKACYEAWRGDAYLLARTAREIRDGAHHEGER